MRRREFITLLGGAAAWPLPAPAQQSSGMPVVGYLGATTLEAEEYQVAAFRQGLSEAGYVEGRNVAIAYRWEGSQFGRAARQAEMVAELVRGRVTVLVAANLNLALAAKAAATGIPIVFSATGDPIATGLVASLNRPDGNITGITSIGGELAAKRLGLLHELVPGAARFAVLVDPITTFDNRRIQLVTLAARHRMPAIYPAREFADAGGLMSYGANRADQFRQVGVYAGRALRGEKPADLPVMQASRFEFVINLRTTKALGLTVPPGLRAIADEVIE